MPINQGAPGGPSQLVAHLTDPATGLVLTDALVLRGYLGQSDEIARLRNHARVLRERDRNVQQQAVQQFDGLVDQVANDGLYPRMRPWRLYLSASMERYVEFYESDVLAHEVLTDPDRTDVVVVWLRNRDYTVVTTGPLQTRDGFVRGRIVDDYMSCRDSRQAVWEEQDYGYTTGKPTFRTCMGA